MDLGKKLHMSLDDLIKSEHQHSSKKKPKGSDKPVAKMPKDKKTKQDSAARLKVKADPRKKTRAGKARVEPTTVRGGKRGQSAGGKRIGTNSAVRVRFGAPKIMTQPTQRHVVREAPVQASNLASFVSSLQLHSKKEAQRALKLAKQIEAMAQEKLGYQLAVQPAPRTAHNGRAGHRVAYSPEAQAQRLASHGGSARRMQRTSPPTEPANPLHDPSRYDHGWDEYVDDEMEQDVKPTMAQLHARTRRMAH
eukprot:jgi/Ulvmu1/12909/UM098_0097.1